MTIDIDKEAEGQHPNYKKALVNSLKKYGDLSTVEEIERNLEDARERNSKWWGNTHQTSADCMILYKMIEENNEFKNSAKST